MKERLKGLLSPGLSIAKATFKEGIRNRVFYNLFIFGLLVIGSSLILNKMTVGDETKIIKDLGLTCISLFGLLIAVLVGTNLVYKEFEEKIVHTILTKPLSRNQYLCGKFLGVILILSANLVIMTALILGLLVVVEGVVFWSLLKAAYLILVELILLSGLTIFFSTFMRPQLSIFTILAIFVIGHSTSEVRTLLAGEAAPALKAGIDFVYYLFPNFDNFDIKSQVVHNLSLQPFHLLWATLYGFFYTVVLLTLGGAIFRKREL